MNPNQNNINNNPVQNGAPNNNYDFILNPEKPKKNMFPFSGQGMMPKVFFMLAILIVVVILIVVLKNSLTTSTISKTDFKSLVVEQQKIINITSVDFSPPTSQQLTAKNLNSLSTIKLVVQSDQSTTLNYLSKHGLKISPKQLNNVKNVSQDNAIKTASDTGTLNQEYIQVMGTELDNYLKLLKNCQITTHGKNGQNLLSQEVKNVNALINQLGAN